MTSNRPNIEVIYFNAGGGHRTAAFALREAMHSARYDWQIDLVQLQELLRPVDPVYKTMGFPSEELYNAALKRGWTYGSRQFLRMLQTGILIEAPAVKRQLRNWWSERAPDLVVSVVPNFNRVMFEALRDARPGTPFVTVMTDMADVPPHYWMEKQDQYLICGTRKASLQAHLSGYYRPDRILEVSGMIIRPSFYASLCATPKFTRENLGLAPDKTVALVMFGGNGSEESLLVVEKLSRIGAQCIVLCGRNDQLLKALGGRDGVCPVPFTGQVAEYMRLADLFVGKPGPGSISEALLVGLPVVVTNNARTMVQERYNVTWVEEHGLGIGIDGYHQLDAAVRFLLDGSRLEDYRRRANLLNNRAVFEIPAYLKSILDHPQVS